MACTGSPGTRWISEKTRVATPNTTGMVRTMRRIRKRDMGQPVRISLIRRLIDSEPCHQFRETLAREPELHRRPGALPASTHERRTNEALLEHAARGVE